MTLHLLHLSDIHFAAGGIAVNGRDPAARLTTVLNAVSDRAVDALVLTGDLTDDGTHAAAADLVAMLAPLGLPTLAVPGNHDDPQVIRDLFGPDVLELGPWRIIGMDSSRPGQIHGSVDVGTEMARIDRYDERPTLLTLHHPPVSPSTHEWFQLDGAAELTAAVARRPHLRALLTGHLHDPFEAGAVIGAPSTLIAFQHDGDRIVIGGTGRTGARLCALHEDGTVASRFVQA
ncbi:metallophosphoesterase [Actinoplanes sp. NBC_00393]|uniref:metallophosphoesterase n=1 Tax=Actinoplanes sp. NBC_00393 TaxID=2975953 RepID=UPI002E22C166